MGDAAQNDGARRKHLAIEDMHGVNQRAANRFTLPDGSLRIDLDLERRAGLDLKIKRNRLGRRSRCGQRQKHHESDTTTF